MIRAFMDCCSAHLTPETWAWLDARLADPVLRDPADGAAATIAGGRTRYGWFVFAPEDPDADMPEDLREVCALARRRGAEYVLLDCDAAPDQELPVRHRDAA